MLVITKSFIGRVKFGQKEDAGVYTWIAYPNDQYAMHSAVMKVTPVSKNHEEGEEEKKHAHVKSEQGKGGQDGEEERKIQSVKVGGGDSSVEVAPAPARVATLQPFKQFELFLN
ncbi:MAG: hypothetical protein V1728_01500 [Candidatus Micrarchaeota archaeon]